MMLMRLRRGYAKGECINPESRPKPKTNSSRMQLQIHRKGGNEVHVVKSVFTQVLVVELAEKASAQFAGSESSSRR